MRQFRADVDDDLCRRIRISKVELEAETNAKLLERPIYEVENNGN